MRRALPLATAALLAAALAGQPASAQQKPGWVDPPAKPAAPEAGKAMPPKPESKPEGASGAASADAPGRQAARPKRDAQAHRQSYREAAATARRSPERRAEEKGAEADGVRTGRRAALRFSAPSAAPGPAPEAGGSDPQLSGWAGAARRLTADYLDTVSGDGMVGAAPRFYGERIRFHGRTLSLSALQAEKRRFVRRWPERRYEPQGMRTACSAAQASCVVTATVAYEAENAARGARSTGTTELTLTVSFAGERPVIVAESSRVLRRGGSVFGALARPERDA